MAERRMFAKSIIDSDAFLTMPSSTQVLYFHLCMRADDDGFVNNPRSIQRMIGASDDDFKVLLAKRFVLPFENGIVVIKHWRIHNYIQSDRYVETKYLDEKSMLGIKENKAYTFLSECDDCKPLPIGKDSKKDIKNSVDTECIHDVYDMETQVRLDKNSIDKNNNKKENTKRKKKSEMTINDIPNSFTDILDKYSIDGELRESFLYFILMRLKANTKFTEHALDLTIRKAREMYGENIKMQIACVNQSIEHGWLTLYEVKNNYNNASKQVNQSKGVQFSVPVTLDIDEV